MWHKWVTRENVDITTVAEIDEQFYRILRQYVPKKEVFFTLCKDKSFTHYYSLDLQRVGMKVFDRYFGTPQKIERHYRKGLALIREIRQTSAGWQHKLKDNCSPSMLAKALSKFERQFTKTSHIYSVTSFVAIEAWQQDFEQKIYKLIARNNLEAEQLLFSLNKPVRKTALFKLQDEMKQGAAVANLVRKYQFLRSWSIVWHRPLDKNWISSLKVKKTQMQQTYSYNKTVTMLHPNNEEKKCIRIAPYVAFFRDWRDDLRRLQIYSWTFLFKAIAKYLNVNTENLGYLTLDEIGQAIRKGAYNKKLISARKKGCVVTCADKGHKMKVACGKDASKYAMIIRIIAAQKTNIKIKGIAAQRGKAKGRVVVLKSFHDIKKVKPGNILVANTTHPNYLPAMQKAAAFVTNEGGIISHAAIVARELKKPCIVNTKVATKVLNNGDLVEVDANKGIVRKLR